MTMVPSTTGRLRASLLAVALAVTGLPAAAADLFWGGGYIANFRDCVGPNAPTGVIPVTARYEPAELTGNDQSNLSLINPTRALVMNLRMTAGAFPDSFSRGRSTVLEPSVNQLRPFPAIRVIGQQPSVITDASTEVRLRLRVRHFAGLEGCVAEIDLQLARL